MNERRCDVLLFAEDPGAANMIAPLPSALTRAGIASRLVAAERLRPYLADRNVAYSAHTGSATTLLHEAQPRVVASGTSENPASLGLDLIANARTRNVPSVGIVDMAINADQRFRGSGTDPLAYAPDWLIVPDQATAEVYQSLSFRGDRIAVCGHPHDDVVRRRRAELAALDRCELRRQLLPDATPKRPIVVFLAEGPDQLNPAASRANAQYTLTGDGTSDDRTTIVLQEVIAAADRCNPKPHVVLRLHPKNRPDDYAAMHPRIDHVSQGGDPLPLLWCADLVIGMTTFLLVEATILARPTLSVVPRRVEAGWLPSAVSNQIPVVSTRSQLGAAMQDLRTEPSPAALVGDPMPVSGAAERITALFSTVLAHAANPA